MKPQPCLPERRGFFIFKRKPPVQLEVLITFSQGTASACNAFERHSGDVGGDLPHRHLIVVQRFVHGGREDGAEEAVRHQGGVAVAQHPLADALL